MTGLGDSLQFGLLFGPKGYNLGYFLMLFGVTLWAEIEQKVTGVAQSVDFRPFFKSGGPFLVTV